jgi:alanine dehydrogenase
VKIANEGVEGAASDDPALARGLSTLRGELVAVPVAEAHDLPWTSREKVLHKSEHEFTEEHHY